MTTVEPGDARRRAEIVKLARLLGTTPERFAYLSDVPLADLRVLRERATDVLFSGNRAVFERIAAASKLVPSALTAAIAQKAFGALLCARVASVLEPERAVDLANRLPVPFLADVAADLDPRRIGGVLARLDTDLVVSVARELVRREDHVTMGGFVDELPEPTLRAVVAALPEASLLRTAVFSEDETRFPALFALIGDDRLPAVLDAVDDPDLLPLVTALDEVGLARLADAAADHPRRSELAAAADGAGLLDRLGPLAVALRGE